jgi:hypothetical protein
LATG